MQKKHQTLLTVDGIANVVLGIILLLYPFGLDKLLGLPQSEINFYPTILGGAILGIGIALLLERFGFAKNIRGLGLAGAIMINYCGGLTLLAWLIFYPLNIPLHGYIILWIVAIIVLAIGVFETFLKSWRY
jgi:hypothetical protein